MKDGSVTPIYTGQSGLSFTLYGSSDVTERVAQVTHRDKAWGCPARACTCGIDQKYGYPENQMCLDLLPLLRILQNPRADDGERSPFRES